MNQEKRFCAYCGQELPQRGPKKFCNKQCEASFKKGRKVGRYAQARVEAMTLARAASYKEKYLDYLEPGIKELLEPCYITRVSILVEHLQKKYPLQVDLCEHRVRKFLRVFPFYNDLFKKARNFPHVIQRLPPEEFLAYQKYLIENSREGCSFFSALEISESFSQWELSERNIKKSCELFGIKICKRENSFNTSFKKEDSSGSEILGYKQVHTWLRAKRILEDNKFENFFEKPLTVGVYGEWRDIVRRKGEELGVTLWLCIRYIKEKNIKMQIEYSKEKLALYKLKKYLGISEERILDINTKLTNAKSYYEMKGILNTFLLEERILDSSSPEGKRYHKFDFLKKYFSYLNPRFAEEYNRGVSLGAGSTSKEGGSSMEAWAIQKLRELNIPFESQVALKSSVKSGLYKIDLVINKSKCIEIQGDYWHAHPLEYNYDIPPSKLNSVFPLFIYPSPPKFKKRDINEMQKQGIKREMEKHSLMCKKYGAENIYYIWEYDIKHYPEEVVNFLKGVLNESEEK